MNQSRLIVAAIAAIAFASPLAVKAQQQARRPLTSADIDDIARIEMIEDRRQVDTLNTVELARLLAAAQLEVRRRAVITVGRLADRRGIALLRARPLDPDSAVAASTVWAIGQIHDSSTVGWLDSLLTNARTMPTVATEAAIALGKMKGGGARDALAHFLTSAILTTRSSRAIGEALLSIGRMPRGDLTPIVKWTTSQGDNIRWSATWALARLRDPGGVKTLLPLTHDKSPLIRSWAVRGLGRPAADSAGLDIESEHALLLATADADRTVRTEAVRTLGSYADSAAVRALITSVASTDGWIAVSAAEGLGTTRSPAAVPALVAATRANRPCAVRVTARQALQTFAQDTARPALQALAREPAIAALVDIANDTVPYCRTTAIQALRRLTTLPAAGTSLRTAVDSVLAHAPPATPAQPRPAAAPLSRTLADYRAIVERWVVPDYEGKPHPTAQWVTTRGTIDLELYGGDAPLAVDDFVHRIESGAIVGTQFTRVVPDFVDQQETIRGGSRIRDEVNRRGLSRANLAWATAGLDTGNPGYTLGHTPQPHNEGSFTSLGRVVRGMDIADRIELGDRVMAAKMLTGGTAGRP